MSSMSLRSFTPTYQVLHTCKDEPALGSKLLRAEELLPGFTNVPGASPIAISFCLLYATKSGWIKSRSFLYLLRAASASSVTYIGRQNASVCDGEYTSHCRISQQQTYCGTRNLLSAPSALSSSPTHRSPLLSTPSSSAAQRPLPALLRRLSAGGPLQACDVALSEQRPVQ